MPKATLQKDIPRKAALASVKQKNALAVDFLNQITNRLTVEQAKLENELNKFARRNPRVAGDFNSTFPDYGDKDDENAAEVADYAANISIEQDLEKTLRDVATALKKIADGTYGVCKYCGKPIEAKRLLARPTSSACVECKKAITQEA